ncbi:MAG: hypothetical protein ABI549_02530 [Flavobacterium sp.]|uniref:hypothetical protein n=1 Tax=Flavobacterium sp. TaxID=239 RepID=UPI003264811D
MIKIFNLLILGLFFICSKNKTTVDNDKINLVNLKIENTINKDFNGIWNYEFNSDENELLNKTFELKLITEKDIIKAQYCAITKGGRKIDCNDKVVYNINGNIKNNIAYVDFKGFFDIKAKGKAKIYYEGNNLIWEIISVEGEIFAPKKAILNPVKSSENTIEGLYVLKTCEGSRFKIKIIKKDNAFEYSILDQKKSISKGLVKIEKDKNKTYLTFGKIQGIYDDANKIQIQNYGNSMNEYAHFTQCDEKYLSFIKQ